MNNKLVIQMLKNGWDLKDINKLVRKSKAIEKQLALNKKYENKYKIVDFKRITKYYCFKHKCYHRKYRNTSVNGKIIKVKTDSFIKCMDNAYRLSDSETFRIKLKRNLKNYSLKSHKQSSGSRCQ